MIEDWIEIFGANVQLREREKLKAQREPPAVHGCTHHSIPSAMALPSLAHWPILLIFIYLASSCHSANYEYNLLVPMSDSSSAQWMSVAKLAAVELSNSWPAHTFKVNVYDHMDSMVTIGQLAYQTVQNTSVLGVAVLSSNPNLVLQSAITLNFASVR